MPDFVPSIASALDFVNVQSSCEFARSVSTTCSPMLMRMGSRSPLYPSSSFAMANCRFFVFANGSQQAATLNQVNRPGITIRPIVMMIETMLLVRCRTSSAKIFASMLMPSASRRGGCAGLCSRGASSAVPVCAVR